MKTACKGTSAYKLIGFLLNGLLHTHIFIGSNNVGPSCSAQVQEGQSQSPYSSPDDVLDRQQFVIVFSQKSSVLAFCDMRLAMCLRTGKLGVGGSNSVQDKSEVFIRILKSLRVLASARQGRASNIMVNLLSTPSET